VEKYVVSSWLAESTAALDLATKGLVEPAMFACLHAATVARSTRTSCVLIARRRSIAGSVIPRRTHLPPSRSGPGPSNAPTLAAVFMTAANTLVSKHAIDRMQIQLIARDPPMLSLIVLAARHVFQTSRVLVERPARILYPIARSLATMLLTAVISASSCVTKGSAGPVWKKPQLRADADVTLSLPSVTKELRKRHSVCAFAVCHSTAAATSVESTAAPASVKLLNDRRLGGSHARWTLQPRDQATTLRQSTSAPVLAVAS
jgi:hypothetical protein